MVIKKISRRKALAMGGLAVAGGLAGLVKHFSGEPQQAEKPTTDLSNYRVLDAYIDSDGEKVLQIQFDNDKANGTFYEVTDFSHSSRFPNLSMSVGSGRLRSSEPDSLFGYGFDGMSSVSSGTEVNPIKRIYDAEVAQGIQFKDLTTLDPAVRLEDREYNQIHQIAGFELQIRDSKGSFNRTLATRVKYAAGLNTKEHMTFLLPPLESYLQWIFEETTGREFYDETTPMKGIGPKEDTLPTERVSDLRDKMIAEFPTIVKSLDLKGPVVVPLEVFRDNKVPESYRKAFPDLQIVGKDYKVAVLTRN